MTDEAPPIDAAERALRRAQWQASLFGDRARRFDLLKLRAAELGALSRLRIRVFRNHAFEYAASALERFGAYAGHEIVVEMGDYDDALSALDVHADVALLWLDFERYRAGFPVPEDLVRWLASRIDTMRASFAGPILIAGHVALGEPDAYDTAVESALSSLAKRPGVHILPAGAVARAMGPDAAERRPEASGTRWSDRLHIELARRLGLQWLPASVGPRLKAIALDLDHTLYAGVLGEDGPTGVHLTPGHRAFQERLVQLRDDGFLLAVVSRNEQADVSEMFRLRTDFPLRAEHVSAWSVNWGSKAEGLSSVAERLRIGVDAIVFVDDNPGELAAVATAHPTTRTVHASADTDITTRALVMCPGMFAWSRSAEDGLRAADLAASDARAELAASAADPVAYLRSLEAVLTFDVPTEAALKRVFDLSNKTNQFNLGFARFTEADVAERAASPGGAFVTVGLRDRLSDSGVIASIGGALADGGLIVDELCISCRALGRGLEDKLITDALEHIATRVGATRVGLKWRRGPRNAPALSWLERYVRRTLPAEHEEGVEWLDSLPVSPSLPIHTEWTQKS